MILAKTSCIVLQQWVIWVIWRPFQTKNCFFLKIYVSEEICFQILKFVFFCCSAIPFWDVYEADSKKKNKWNLQKQLLDIEFSRCWAILSQEFARKFHNNASKTSINSMHISCKILF